MASEPEAGRIVWWDLTVPDAEAVRDFYADLLGWTAKDHPVGDYVDYEMRPAGSEETVAGICHQRGANADLPPVWLPYVRVADVDAAAARALARGGRIVAGPRAMGGSRFCVVEDPAGAKLALFGPAAPEA